MIIDYILFNRTLKQLMLKAIHNRRLHYSRKRSKSFLREIRGIKGRSVIDRKTKKRIRKYAKKKFGSVRYADWLMVYTELRGKFKEGWMPDDFFSYEFLPYLNDSNLSHLSELKTFDHILFHPHGIVPLAKKINGMHFDSKNNKITEFKFISSICDYNGDVVIKKDNVQSGVGVSFISAKNVSSGHFQKGFNYLIQPVVQQHAVLEKIHKYSISTLRITTYIDSSGEVNIKHRSLRIGDKENRMVNQSGMFLFLNEEGEASSNIYSRIGIDLGPFHPDSGADVRTLKVPGVMSAVNICKEMHLKFPYLRFIAWDFYIDESETPKIIEWNTIHPGMWENEALIGPLWGEEEIGEVLGGSEVLRGRESVME